MQLLSPLLAEGLDAAQAREIKYQICEQAGISERTVRRYMAQYQTEGFAGLKPRDRNPHRSGDAIPPEILDQAVLLRREVPRRSVAQIIQILEWEGLIAPGYIRRSTLQDKLMERGYSTRQMKIYAETSGRAVRSFQRRHRNQLWSSDIKLGRICHR